jgi:hypothetical protein
MLRDAKPKLRKTILGDKGLLTCLCECSKNILKGNVPLSPVQKRKLRRHRRSLRELTLKKISKKKKNKILQKGGFLGALITPILSLLGGMLGSS